MSTTDPIADMLTKIRNASRARRETVELQASGLKQRMLELLKREGFIRSYKLLQPDGSVKRQFRIYLKSGPERAPAISAIRRVSRPGLRRYVGSKRIPRVLGGLGVAIVSTSQGLMTGQEARTKGLGGEVLCYIW